MISQLTGTERRLDLVLAIVLALTGLTMAGAAKQGPMAVHGFMAITLGIVLAFALIGQMFEPEPGRKRLSLYFDDPIKAGILMAMFWDIIAPDVSSPRQRDFGTRHRRSGRTRLLAKPGRDGCPRSTCRRPPPGVRC